MRSLILLGEAVLIRRVMFVRHRLPSLILIAFDTYATTYRSWSGLQILPLGAFRKLILPPIRRRQDEWQQTIYPARFPLE